MPAGTDPQDIYLNGRWFSRSGQPILPTILAATGLAVILPSDGTIATNGTLTLTTALPTTYAQAWCFFPAGAVSGDATGGLYYCVFSSTTQATVYAGKQGGATGATSAFIPFVPTSLVAVTGSNAAYVQTLATEIALANLTIPAGALGPNGALRVEHSASFASSAGIKALRTRLGGTSAAGVSGAFSDLSGNFGCYIANRNNQALQVCINSGGVYQPYGRGAVSATYMTVNTANQTALTLMHQIGLAADYSILESALVNLYPA
jgi:hypothetical protein